MRKGNHAAHWRRLLAALWLLAAACAWADNGTATEPAAPAIALGPQTAGESIVGHSRYWIDDSARMTIDQIAEAGDHLPWRRRDGNLQHNLDGRALWIQFDAIAQGDGRWYLEIGSSGLDRGQLFHRDPAGRWVTQEAGDTKPVSQWPLPGRAPTFELSHEPGKAVRYWVRIEHARVDFAAPMRLYDQPHLVAARESEQFLLGGYFGLSALITIVSALNAVCYRDRSFAAYSLYVALLAVSQLAYLGVGAQHVWVHWLKWNAISTFMLPGLASAAGLWFARTVTEPARFSRLLDAAVWTMIAALLAAVALDTAIATRVTFGLMMILTSVALALVVGLITTVWLQGDDNTIRLIALGFVPVVVMAVFPVARGLNLIPNSVFTRYGLSIGAALEMPILFYALSLRGSRRREAEVRASALSRNDALTGLANSRTLLQRLESALVRATSQKHPCALLGVHIANYEAILVEFGREATDKALVVAASHLRRAVTDVDLAARVGECEFTLLVEGPTTTAVALTRAQQVVASGLRQADALPPGLMLRFHVAVAMLPDRGLDAPGSLKWVLGELAVIPGDARKLIRSLNF